MNFSKREGKKGLTTRDHRSGALVLLVLLAMHDELLKSLERTSDLLLADLGQLHDLAERPRDSISSAGEKDASCYERLLALALEDLTLIGVLEEVLGRIGDAGRQLPSVAQCANLLVGLEEGLVALVQIDPVLSAVELLAARAAIAERNIGVQLSAVEQSIWTVTDTRWVIIALIIVGEGTPFGRGIDGSLLQDETAVGADQVTTRVVFEEVGRVLTTVAADKSHIQIFVPLLFLLPARHVGYGARREDLCHSGKQLARRRDGLLDGQCKPLGCALLDAFGTLLKLVVLGVAADEKWRIRVGGVDGRVMRCSTRDQIAAEGQTC